MTQKQQFISKFLKNVYKFDEVEFEASSSGEMAAVGYYRVNNVLSGQTRIRVPVDIWMDRTKDGSWSIKFKTYATHIHPKKADEFVQRAQLYWPGASKIEVYRRRSGCAFSSLGAPTLRIRTNVRPWAKKRSWADVFQEWLMVHKALEPFKANLKKYRNTDMETYTKNQLFVSSAVAGAFVWKGSEEGDLYWRKLSGEWEAYVGSHLSFFQSLQ